MKILYYSIPPYADSDFPLIKALREKGHEVFYMVRLAPFMLKTTLFNIERIHPESCVLPASAYKEFSAFGDYLDLEKTFISNDAVGKTGWKSFRLFLQEMRVIKRISPDVYHHVGIPFVFHLFALFRYRRNSVCVIHDPFPHSGEGSLRDTLKCRIMPLTGCKFVLLNRQRTDDFCRKYSILHSRVYHARFGNYDCYRSFRTQRMIEGKYLLFFGRLSLYKGLDYALEAFAKVSQSFPDVRFVIAGDGQVCFNIPSSLAAGSVEFIHRYLTMEEIADYASCAQFVVCPYTDATQSGVIQTAFGLGVPVVATDVGNFQEVVTDGVNGLIVPPRDTEALAGAFSELLGNPGKLDAMRSALSAGSSGETSWSAIADSYSVIYDS